MILDNAKSIELSDKPVIDEYFSAYPPEVSELTFTNLFIWRHYYNFQFKEIDNHLVIFSDTYLKEWKKPINGGENTIFFLPPIGGEQEKIMIKLFEHIDDLEFHRIPESLTERLQDNEKFESLGLAIKEDRANWDYVYERQKLIDLPGNKYRQKRRNLEDFKKNYDYEFHLIEKKWIEKCRELQSKWCDMNECQKNEDLHEENKAINYALDNFKELGYNGGLIMIGDECAAYTLGERLNKNTSVIHIEKAHIKFQGSYQAINQLFVKKCCDEIKYINREQDLGVEGLRRAKKSYKPVFMVKKSIIHKT